MLELDLERMRDIISALSESDAKSILMLTAVNLQMALESNGKYTFEECVDQLIKLYSSIPNLNQR